MPVLRILLKGAKMCQPVRHDHCMIGNDIFTTLKLMCQSKGVNQPLDGNKR